MKQLNEFLSTKIEKVKGGFPEIPKTDEIISFLEQNGFVKCDYEHGSESYFLTMAAMESNVPLYLIGTAFCNTYLVEFCNPGKISADNPIFAIRTTHDGSDPKERIKSNYAAGWILKDDQVFRPEYCKTYAELRGRIEKYFGWE